MSLHKHLYKADKDYDYSDLDIRLKCQLRR